MKTKTVLTLLAVIAGVWITATFAFKVSPPPEKISSSSATPAPQIVEAPPAVPVERIPEIIAPTNTSDAPVALPPKAVANKTPAAPREPLHDPAAREALTFVGADPEAEAYWVDAIFDPSLPANEREDLMEDLNEDGLSDPKHATPEDVPLILNRLALIEEIAPYGDEFMDEHLGEAYKDLSNLLAGLSPQ